MPPGAPGSELAPVPLSAPSAGPPGAAVGALVGAGVGAAGGAATTPSQVNLGKPVWEQPMNVGGAHYTRRRNSPPATASRVRQSLRRKSSGSRPRAPAA